jgi:hypothetical protein
LTGTDALRPCKIEGGGYRLVDVDPVNGVVLSEANVDPGPGKVKVGENSGAVESAERGE